MNPSSSKTLVRTTLALGALAGIAAIGPVGCFFPEFTFNEDTGGGGTATTSDGGGGTTTTTSTTTTGGGGTGGMTTSMMTTGGTGGMTTTSATGGTGGTGGMGGTGGVVTGGGGTGGSTMTTSTTTTDTMSTTTSTLPPVEACQNGVDDDADLKVDCQDSDCAGYSCVNSVPNGWAGPYLVYSGPSGGDPGCTAAFPTEVYLGFANLNAPPAECTACSCGAPQGAQCMPPAEIDIYDAPCGMMPNTARPLFMPAGWSGTCATAYDPNGMIFYYWGGGDTTCGPSMTSPCNVSITATAPTVLGGFCAASGGMATIQPAKWDGFVRACGGAVLTGKGCTINQTCQPTPQAPYIGGLCIKKAGNNNCPAGAYNTKHLSYDDFTDSRMCTSCNCGSPTGQTCAGNISTYGDTFINQCLAPTVTFPAGSCAALNNNPNAGNSKFTVTTPPNGGSCTATGGVPSGTAAGTFPQTFCCINN